MVGAHRPERRGQDHDPAGDRTPGAVSVRDQQRREQELTVIAAMHELTLAGQYADRLALVVDGRLAAVGPAVEVLTERAITEHYRAQVRVIQMNGSGTAVVPVRN